MGGAWLSVTVRSFDMAAHYQLYTQDERYNNYVTMLENLDGLPPAILRPYSSHACSACGLPNTKALFEGTQHFEAPPRIRVALGREFAESGEGFLLVKDRVIKLLAEHRVAGYATRALPGTEWHVLRVTATVPFKKFKPVHDKLLPRCKICGYWPYYGVADALHQIGLPPEDNTFFTPDLERPQGQDVYLTERVALMLKANRAKGAELHRLLTEAEYKSACTGPEARRKIKHRIIFL
jgi:hypothetical protein